MTNTNILDSISANIPAQDCRLSLESWLDRSGRVPNVERSCVEPARATVVVGVFGVALVTPLNEI